MRPFVLPIHKSLTVRLDAELLRKVDSLAVLTCRSRADLVRQLIVHAEVTGQVDLACELPQGEPA